MTNDIQDVFFPRSRSEAGQPFEEIATIVSSRREGGGATRAGTVIAASAGATSCSVKKSRLQHRPEICRSMAPGGSAAASLTLVKQVV